MEFQDYVDKNREALTNLRKIEPHILKAKRIIIEAINQNKCIYLCGNGGSAAMADHFVAELVGRFCKKRKSIKAVSLSSNGAVITCIGNDFGYEDTFSRWVTTMQGSDSILIALSTSGTSKNIVNAINLAKERNIQSIMFSSVKSSLNDCEDSLIIKVPSVSTDMIQLCHQLILHFICVEIDEMPQYS